MKIIISIIYLLLSILYLHEGINLIDNYSKTGRLWFIIVDKEISYQLIIYGILLFIVFYYLMFKKINQNIYIFIISFLLMSFIYPILIYFCTNIINFYEKDFYVLLLLILTLYILNKKYNYMNSYIFIINNYRKILLNVLLFCIIPFIVSTFIKYEYFSFLHDW